MRTLFLMLTSTCFLFLSTTNTSADLIKLNNGGEIRGKVDRSGNRTNGNEVKIQTLTGAVITVSRDDLEFITVRSLRYEEYETRVKKMENTVTAHWELAEWCKENYLKTQRTEHLELLLELDPDHEKAHYALGHTQRNGKWMSRDADMKAQGFVKYKGRYITPQQLEIIEKTEAERSAENEWYKNIRRWATALESRYPARQKEAYEKLQEITDPHAVSSLSKIFSDDPNRLMRLMYLQILKKIPGPKPVGPLALQSLQDVDYEVRYEARSAIPKEHAASAIPVYVSSLKDDSNEIVKRAATALQIVGDDSAVPHLIEALVTTHKYRVVINDPNSTMSFGSDGSFGNGQQGTVPPEIEAMMRTGQLPQGVIINNPQAASLYQKKKIRTIKHNHQNEPVLIALRKLTNKNFGYDERTWRLWFTAQKNGAIPVAPPNP